MRLLLPAVAEASLEYRGVIDVDQGLVG